MEGNKADQGGLSSVGWRWPIQERKKFSKWCEGGVKVAVGFDIRYKMGMKMKMKRQEEEGREIRRGSYIHIYSHTFRHTYIHTYIHTVNSHMGV